MVLPVLYIIDLESLIGLRGDEEFAGVVKVQ